MYHSIVAVHGLNGHPFGTWTADSDVCWLQQKDLLPKTLPTARVLSWGYNADAIALLGSTSSNSILQHAQTLIAELEANRAVRECCFEYGQTPVWLILCITARGCRREANHFHLPFPGWNHCETSFCDQPPLHSVKLTFMLGTSIFRKQNVRQNGARPLHLCFDLRYSIPRHASPWQRQSQVS